MTCCYVFFILQVNIFVQQPPASIVNPPVNPQWSGPSYSSMARPHAEWPVVFDRDPGTSILPSAPPLYGAAAAAAPVDAVAAPASMSMPAEDRGSSWTPWIWRMFRNTAFAWALLRIVRWCHRLPPRYKLAHWVATAPAPRFVLYMIVCDWLWWLLSSRL